MSSQWIKELRYFKEIDSTQDYAFSCIRNGDIKENTVITSEVQKKGRGRRSNAWISPKGGLWLSLVIVSEISQGKLPLLGIGMCLAIIKAIKKKTKIKTMFHWPNDIYVGNEKLAGILSETETQSGKAKFIIIGAGINTNLGTKDFPEDTKATSIKIKTGSTIDNLELLNEILEQYSRIYSVIVKDGLKPVLKKEIMNNFDLNGKTVCINNDNKNIACGKLIGIDDTGALLLQEDTGEIKKIMSGHMEEKKK